jgi:hypothetical protein
VHRRPTKKAFGEEETAREDRKDTQDPRGGHLNGRGHLRNSEKKFSEDSGGCRKNDEGHSSKRQVLQGWNQRCTVRNFRLPRRMRIAEAPHVIQNANDSSIKITAASD